ncbi:MAG TPA: hypothetical protein VNI01_15405, partial [Elusimicrobiota bacterium]|nr:hypothetical protein [Elusimicrobiota bacterium]
MRRPSAERRPPPFVVRGAPAPAAAGPEAPAYELPLILLGVVLLLAAPLAERTLAPSGSRDGSLARDFGLAAADPGDQRSALDVRGGASAQPEEPMVTPLEGRDSTALMLPRKRDAGGADRSAAVAGSSAEGPAGAGLADASAASGAGSTASSGPPGSSWKDAISAARSAAAQASSKASFPRANPRMQAGIQEALAKLPGLDKSLGAATSSASLPAQQLASPTSERLVGTPRVITSLTAPKTPGDFRGAASRGLAPSGFGLLSPGVRGGS